MRALITGGGGFLGSHLAARLSSRGDEVRCLVREGARADLLASARAELARGDVTAPKTLEAAVRGVEVVFHLAGVRRAPDRESFFRVNAEGTRNVCRAAAAAGAKRLVLASSLAVHGPSSPGRPHVESDPFAPTEWYGESKVAAEEVAHGFRDRLDVAVARPPRIMGPGDRENLLFFRLVQHRVELSILGPPRRISIVDVEDAVDLLLLLAERSEAVGEAFLAPGPADVTQEELQEEISRALGRRPWKVPLPPALLTGAAAAADAASKLFGRNLPLNRKLARQLLAPGWCCSGAKAERILGWRPSRSPAESVAAAARWYREHRWI